MEGLNRLFEGKLDVMQEALGRTTRRHSMLSRNLANLNTSGYKRQDCDFNVVLGDVQKRNQAQKEQHDQQASDRTSLRQDGNNVDLEREVMGVAETELRYQALTQMTSDYFQGLRNVIREGR